jgi:hypothetical protein
MFAPMRTQQLIPSVSAINLDIMQGPSVLTSMPLMREMASAPALACLRASYICPPRIGGGHKNQHIGVFD